MGHYLRLLTPSEKRLSVKQLRAELKKEGLGTSFVLDLESGTEKAWGQLMLRHSNGPEIALIERNVVKTGSLGEEEIQEFLDDIVDYQPASAVDWLRQYLPKVKVIYAFQILNGTDVKNGWQAFHCVRGAVSSIGGITQADYEGFSNEKGYHILWQFADDITGLWWMGVLKEDKWVHYQMDLGNRKHRAAFFRGDVPKGVKIAD